MPILLRPSLLTLLLLLSTPLSAQYGPAANPPGAGGGVGHPAPVGQAMAVPAYIKPGFQMLYTTASSTESDDPKKAGSAGMGFSEYTVLAVMRDKVLVTVANYLTPNGMPLTAQGAFDPNTDPRVQLIGSNSYAITALDVQGGNAMWIPADELAAWQGGSGVEVRRHPWPYDGRQVNATTLTVKGSDHISSSTSNSDDGMKLTMRSASGQMRRGDLGNNPFNRKNQSQMQLVATKQLQGPLLGADWPDWAKRVKTMRYAGTYTMAVPGVQTPGVQITSTVEFTERSPGLAIGKSTLQVQGGAPQSAPVVQGPGSLLGYWVHPEVLANLGPGTIDQNDLMRTTLTYQVQQGNLGRLGVFVLTNQAQTFYAVSGYNLQTGALSYISLHTDQTGVTIELMLQGTEQ